MKDPSETPVLEARDIEAVIASMLATTLGLSRNETSKIRADTLLDDDELGIDSLDLLNLSQAVSRFFNLYDSGHEELLLQRRSVSGWIQTVLEARNTPPQLTFRTSGSTGEPVDCRHALASLEAEIEVLSTFFADRARIVGIVPRHHIYGFLFTVLLPHRLGLPYVDLRGATVSEVHRELMPLDLLVGFPLRWDEFAAARRHFAPDIVGATSTGSCRPATIETLQALGLGRMFEIYGSSQTAGIAWRTDPHAPYRLFPYWSLAVDDDALVRRDDAGGTSTALPLPDRIRRRDDGFDVLGRYDGAVSVGGVNVFPARIAARIRTHPDVADCTVRPMRAEEGERLKAFVVLHPRAATSDESAANVRRWLRTNFSAAECPKPVTFGAAIPIDVLGKPADW